MILLELKGVLNSSPLQFALAKISEIWREDQDLIIELRYASVDDDLQQQGYRLTVDQLKIKITGADDAGLMYALLDVAHKLSVEPEYISWQDQTVNPFIARRGIKFNIPLDARTPSYSDSGDSAQENIGSVWDMAFWRDFLDKMAENKYNVLTLWSMSPGPSMVRVPEYPEVALADVKRAVHAPNSTLRGIGLYTQTQQDSLVTLRKMTIEDKIDFWNEVMRYAAKRCISVYIFIWSIYVYGTEHTSYGITDDADNPVTKDYIKATVRELVKTYPLLAGIGVTAGENMRKEWKTDVKEDIEWIYDTYGKGIMEALPAGSKRDFTLIHRSHMTSPDQIEDIFKDFTYNFEMSFKYSMAHMHSVEKPHFGDQFFSALRPGRKSWLTVRNDDMYFLRWGDPDFARRYLTNMPIEQMAGYYMGSDGIIWAKDYSSRDPELSGQLVIDKNWYAMKIWGQLSYNIDLPDAYFISALKQHPVNKADEIFKALKLASGAFTLQQRVYWRDYDFQWYPECSCSYLEAENTLVFRSIIDFIKGQACPGTGYLSISEYTAALISGDRNIDHAMTPAFIAEQMETDSTRALDLISQHKLSPDMPFVRDIVDMSHLNLYYASKIKAAIALSIYFETREQQQHAAATEKVSDAYQYWLKYSGSVALNYRPLRFSRLRNVLSPDLFNDYVKLDLEIVEKADLQI